MITGLILIACTYVLDYLVCAFLMPLTLDMHYFLTHKCATKIEPRYTGKIGSLDSYVPLMPGEVLPITIKLSMAKSRNIMEM